MKFVWLVFLVAACMCTEEDDLQEQAFTLCERTLAHAHFMFCYSTEEDDEDTQTVMATSVPPLFDALSSTAPPKSLPRYHQLLLKLIPHSQLRPSELALRTKRTPGLADICCLRPCYISELLNYC